ncbi:hypothetical protein OF83DRAFT_250519 [Amylostereum chailletii]|nr:hypothetical protein OF83DRAFT_250519 [Amylostereum chailletii]
MVRKYVPGTSVATFLLSAGILQSNDATVRTELNHSELYRISFAGRFDSNSQRTRRTGSPFGYLYKGVDIAQAHLLTTCHPRMRNTETATKMSGSRKTVLLTGCTTGGIGHALALEFFRRGHL